MLEDQAPLQTTLGPSLSGHTPAIIIMNEQVMGMTPYLILASLPPSQKQSNPEDWKYCVEVHSIHPHKCAIFTSKELPATNHIFSIGCDQLSHIHESWFHQTSQRLLMQLGPSQEPNCVFTKIHNKK